MARCIPFNGTLAASPVTLTAGFNTAAWGILNKHASNEYTFTDADGQAWLIPANSYVVVPVDSRAPTLNGTGDYIVYASDSVEGLALSTYAQQSIADGSIVAADFAAGALSADATGRAVMAADFFNGATVIDKFDTDAIDLTDATTLLAFAADGLDATALEKLLAANAYGTGGAARLAFATDFFNFTTADRAVADLALSTDKLGEAVWADVTLGAEAANVIAATIAMRNTDGTANVAARRVIFRIEGELAATYTLSNAGGGATKVGTHGSEPTLVVDLAAGVGTFDITDVAGASGVAVLLSSTPCAAVTGAVEPALVPLVNTIAVTFD